MRTKYHNNNNYIGALCIVKRDYRDYCLKNLEFEPHRLSEYMQGKVRGIYGYIYQHGFLATFTKINISYSFCNNIAKCKIRKKISVTNTYIFHLVVYRDVSLQALPSSQ